eukprot:TRINITY_DN15344_c2_g1_i1.p1 TRINITY_DN15344_c2_g1~~TRINITY_DN15344_c2_g1_i1.p1  ORF type:complete len:250 (-),score=56.93 TRINITY_DN15344_c2_g1_i1:3-692(-)
MSSSRLDRQRSGPLTPSQGGPYAGSSSSSSPRARWEKRWVTQGHLKLYKWGLVKPRRLSSLDRPGGIANSAHHNRQQSRPFNDNAPITRSVTSTHKNIKDALITTNDTHRKPHPLKGVKRDAHGRVIRPTPADIEKGSSLEDDASSPTGPVTPITPSSQAVEEDDDEEDDEDEEEEEEIEEVEEGDDAVEDGSSRQDYGGEDGGEVGTNMEGNDDEDGGDDDDDDDDNA